LTIGYLNCFLSIAYCKACEITVLHFSTSADPILILPTFKQFKAILNPFPLPPSKFSTGTLTSSNVTTLVDDECYPILSSSFPKDIPFISFSIINAVIFLSFSILAKVINIFANPPFVIHIFSPVIR